MFIARESALRWAMDVAVTLMSFSAQGYDTYLTMENDAMLQEDNDYTHGTRLEVVGDGGWHFMVSQTMYAPSDLRREDHIAGDRPYCGMLLTGAGYEFFQDPASPWTHYGELDFGVIGPSAWCKETQTLIHKWLDCKEPKGWDNQLHDEFVANAQWWTKYNWQVADWLAVVPKAGLAAGTIQDTAEAGFDVKIGWNIRPTANNEIMFSAPVRRGGLAERLSAWVYAGVSERFVLYNHVLEGSLFGNRDDGLDVDIERWVTEFRAGAVVKFGGFFATYYVVVRTDEFKHQPNAPNYGGIGIGWTW